MKNFLRFWVFVFFVFVSSAAGATVFTVDRIDDPDPTTANGCDDAVLNDCSLRGAISKANAASGDDEIHLPGGTYQLALPNVQPMTGDSENENANGDLDIKDNLVLTGDGAATTIIDGNHTVTDDRVLDIDPTGAGISVTVSNVTITGGKAFMETFFSSGFGGGVATRALNTTLDHVIVRDNFSGDGGPGFSSAVGGGFGGGVFIGNGTTVIRDSVIAHNTTGNGFVGATGGLGGPFGSAGGAGGGIFINIPPIGSVTIENTTISDNKTGDGGPAGPPSGAGVNGSAGGAGGDGGGIELQVGDLTLKNVTIAGNKTGNGNSGGNAIGAAAGGPGGPGGSGAGIHITSGTLSLNNVTLTTNETGRGGAGGTGTPGGPAGINGPGGGINRSGGTVSVGNSIIAGNVLSTSPVGLPSFGPDCNGVLTSNGFNLIGNLTASCTGFVDGTNGDHVDVGPLFDPAGLKNNGGATETVGLSDGSPAIDAGNSATCETNDQRGVARLDGDADGTATCDIGAFEFERCGDGQATAGEECDDGNTEDGDGCSAACENETGGTAGTATGGTAGTAGTAGTGGTATGGGNDGGGGCSLIR